MNKLFLASALLLSAQAFAGTSLPKTLKCDNGHLDDDRSFQVVINKNGLRLNFWESYLQAKRADLVYSGNSIAILDKKLRGHAEGDAYTNQVSALFVYDAKRKQLAVTYHAEIEAYHKAEKLNCR